MKINVLESPADVASELSAAVALALCHRDGRGAVMLAGGRTPLEGYRRLAESPPDWSRAGRVFLSDERCVPLDAPESNTRAILPVLRSAGMPEDRWIGVDPVVGLAAAAAAFDARLNEVVEEGIRFPLGILGLGADGHTASLFSPRDVADARASGRWVVPVRRSDPPDRISVTPRLLARIERIILVVTGAEKRGVVGQWMSDPRSLTAGLALEGHDGVVMWADRAAAAAFR